MQYINFMFVDITIYKFTNSQFTSQNLPIQKFKMATIFKMASKISIKSSHDSRPLQSHFKEAICILRTSAVVAIFKNGRQSFHQKPENAVFSLFLNEFGHALYDRHVTMWYVAAWANTERFSFTFFPAIRLCILSRMQIIIIKSLHVLETLYTALAVYRA